MQALALVTFSSQLVTGQSGGTSGAGVLISAGGARARDAAGDDVFLENRGNDGRASPSGGVEIVTLEPVFESGTIVMQTESTVSACTTRLHGFRHRRFATRHSWRCGTRCRLQPLWFE